jgi:hypothetical protein
VADSVRVGKNEAEDGVKRKHQVISSLHDIAISPSKPSHFVDLTITPPSKEWKSALSTDYFQTVLAGRRLDCSTSRVCLNF